MRTPKQIKSLLVLVILTLGSFGCALQKANQAFEEGRYEDSLQGYRAIVQNDPSNVKARIGLQRSAQQAAEQVLRKLRNLSEEGAAM